MLLNSGHKELRKGWILKILEIYVNHAGGIVLIVLLSIPPPPPPLLFEGHFI